MNFKKVAPILALVVTTSLLGGCTTDTTYEAQSTQEATTLQENKEEKVYVVKVQNITDHTITAVTGELTQDGPPALPNGETVTGDGPPALPDGETKAESTPSALPDGEAMTNNTPPSDGGGMQSFSASQETITFTIDDTTEITIEMLQGTQEGTLDQIGVNDILEVALNDDHTAKSIIVKNLNAGGGFGGSSTVTQGTSANTIDTDKNITDGRYISTGDDENALRVDNAKVTLDGITVEKTQGNSSNTENGDFYGQNAGLLVTNGAEVTIKNSAVNTTVTNGNGIFSYGEGTVVNVSDSVIHTTGNNSGGIQTTGGGTMNATNLEIETKGNSAAAIRSDRGGGTVKVLGGSYITNGTGSPSIYSTADISVADATLVANNSEALVIEGKNAIALENCNVTGNMGSSNLDENDSVHNIMIYQSMSGDAAIGHSTFTAKNGSITANQGDMIYITNTTCTVELTNVALTLATDTLLNVSGNTSSRGWGTQGSNGGDCTFIATNQAMNGKIRVDDISILDLTLQQGTQFTGSINTENMSGTTTVTIDDSSKWVLTGDSYITEFTGDLSQIETNGYKLFVNGEQVK